MTYRDDDEDPNPRRLHVVPDAEDELWRARVNADPRNRGRTGATKAAREIGPILTRAEALEMLGLEATQLAPSGHPVCRRCGKESRTLDSVAGEVVVLGGITLVGCVRTTCPACISGMMPREAGQR